MSKYMLGTLETIFHGQNNTRLVEKITKLVRNVLFL